MIIASHNSFTYLPVKKWWMKLLAFTAKCQDVNIISQYENYNVRCFDLRIKFNERTGNTIVSHGIIEYDTSDYEIDSILEYLNSKRGIYCRVLLETRTKKQYSSTQIVLFKYYCNKLERSYPNIKFFGGNNLYNWNKDYEFKYNPSVEDKYSSLQKPTLIDDWWPRLYAKSNNKDILKRETDRDILMIDFVNYN